MAFPFCNWQTVIVGLNATNQDMVAIDNQMVGRDRGSEIVTTTSHIIDTIFGIRIQQVRYANDP